MDRQITYPGALPRSADFAQAQQNVMIALGYLAQAVLGVSAWGAGLTCSATSPPSMAVNVGPGILGTMNVLEATAFGSSLAANTGLPLVKAGININGTAMSALTAPGAAGQSQAWVLAGQVLEQDASPVVLPFYNPTNPSQSFAGQANSGASLNTQRAQTVALQWVAGAAATTGSQTAPAVPSGWVPFYIVTVPYGTATITAANIAVHPQSPFLPFTLPQLAPGFSREVRLPSGATSWTVPDGVKLIRVTVVGGGGGGGGAAAGTCAGGGGDGAGRARGIFTVTPKQAFGVATGVGGNGGTPGVDGAAGGTTTFGSLIAAGGGAGGHGAANNSFGTGGGNPGQGAGSGDNYQGGQGTSGSTQGGLYFGGDGGGCINTSGHHTRAALRRYRQCGAAWGRGVRRGERRRRWRPAAPGSS